MTGRLYAAIIALCAVLGGCAVSPDDSMQGSKNTNALCAFDVESAEAWVNRMPTVGESKGPQVNVVARISNDSQIRRLQLVHLRDGALRLAVAPGKAPLVTGTLTWRMHEPDGGLRRIDIACGSDVIATIEEIQSVY